MKKHFKAFVKFISFERSGLFVLGVVITLSLAIFFYMRVGEITQESLNEQMLYREQTIVRAGAESIKSFLELADNSLALLSRDYSVVNQGENTQATLDSFISDWQDTPLVETILTDRQGKILFVANKTSTGMKRGVFVTDRDYFIAAKKAQAGEVFIGKPMLPRLGAFEGQYIVPLATPVYQNGEFKGVLGAAILLPELAEEFLAPLRISDNTKVYLVNSDATFIYSHIAELTGKNVFNYLEEHPFPGSTLLIKRLKKELTKALAQKEGELDFIRNDYQNKTELKQMLLAYSVIDLGEKQLDGRKWILAVETPAEDAHAFTGPFYRNQIVAFVFLILVLIGFSTLGITTARSRQKEAYLKGFKDGKNHRKA